MLLWAVCIIEVLLVHHVYQGVHYLYYTLYFTVLNSL